MRLVLSDRRASKWLNGLCAFVALGAVGTIGVAVTKRRQTERPTALPPAVHDLRQARRAAYAAEIQGDGAEAERQYLAALAKQPDLEDARLGLARTYAAYGKRREAWEIYRPLVEPSLGVRKPAFEGNDTLAWYADLAAEFGSARNAERAAELAIPRKPRGGLPKGKRLLALAHLWAASPRLPRAAARRHAERATELDPAQIAAWLRIAELLLEDSQREEAKDRIAKAEQLAASGSWEDCVTIASFYHRQNRQIQARTALGQAVRRIHPSDSPAWLALSTAADACNRGRGPIATKVDPGIAAIAHRSLEKARQTVRPNDVETLMQIAQDYGRTDLARAKAMVEAAKRTTPPQATRLYGRIATAFLFLGEKDEARAMLRQALRYAPEEERDWIDRALAPLEGREVKQETSSTGGGGYDPYGF